jgi:hypothetical protein
MKMTLDMIIYKTKPIYRLNFTQKLVHIRTELPQAKRE